MENEKKAPVKKEEKKEKAPAKKEETFIMTVGRLDWGANQKNHFYADKKPLITEKVMGKYADTLLIWLENGWIKEGSYK